MKTTWLVAAILAMGVGFHQIKGAHAQVHGGANHGKSIHDNPDHAAKLVNATPEQTKKLKVLHQQVMAKTNAIKARKDLTDAQRKVQFELLHKDERGVPQVPRRLTLPGTWNDGPSLRAPRAAPLPAGG